MNIAVTNKATGESVSFDGDRLKGSIKAVSRANALVRAETKLRSGNPEGGTVIASLDGDREAIISLLSHAVSSNAPFANWVKIEIDGKDVDSVPVEEILGTEGEPVDDLEPPFSDMGDSGEKSALSGVYVYIPQTPAFSLFSTKGLLGPSIGDNGNTVVDRIAAAAGVIRVSNGFRCGPGSANSGTFTDIRGTTCGPRIRQVMNEVGEMISDAVSSVTEARRDAADLADGPDSGSGRDIDVPEPPQKLDLTVTLSPEELDFSSVDSRLELRDSVLNNSREDSPEWILLSRLVEEFGADETMVTRGVPSWMSAVMGDDAPVMASREWPIEDSDDQWTDQIRSVLMPKIDDPEKRQQLESVLSQIDIIDSMGTVVAESIPKSGGAPPLPGAPAPPPLAPSAPPMSDTEANRKLLGMIAGLEPDVRDSVAQGMSRAATKRAEREWELEKARRTREIRNQVADRISEEMTGLMRPAMKRDQFAKAGRAHTPGKATSLRPSTNPDDHPPVDGEIRSVEELSELASSTLVRGTSLGIDDPETTQEAIDVLNSPELDAVIDVLENPFTEEGSLRTHIENRYGFWQHTGIISLTELARQRGFDRRPLRVSGEELDDLLVEGGFQEVGRGGRSTLQQEHLTGDMNYGDGALGGGYYFAPQTFGVDGNETPHYDAAEYADAATRAGIELSNIGQQGDTGSVIRGGVNPEARLLGAGAATEAVENYRRVVAGEEIEISNPADARYQLVSLRMRLMNMARGEGPEAAQAQRALRRLDLLLSADNDGNETSHTTGIAAILMGFDGINTGFQDWPSVDNRVVLYNRSAVVMEDRLLSADEYRSTIGKSALTGRVDPRRRASGKLPTDYTADEREEYINRLVEQELARIPE